MTDPPLPSISGRPEPRLDPAIAAYYARSPEEERHTMVESEPSLLGTSPHILAVARQA